MVPIVSDTIWLTYAELADRLGITGESARNLVRRRQWFRKPGNDGTQRIGVPKEYLDERAMEEALPSPTAAPIEPPIVAAIIPPAEVAVEVATMAALEAHIVTLKEIADHERGRGDLERARADAERARADDLADKLDRLRSEAVTASGQAATHAAKIELDIAELRALVDQFRAEPRPWWRRLAG